MINKIQLQYFLSNVFFKQVFICTFKIQIQIKSLKQYLDLGVLTLFFV